MNDSSPLKGKTGFARIINALGYSVDGLKSSYQNEAAFRQEFWLAVVLIPLALLLTFSLTQKALLVFSMLLVLMLELVNSAIEAVVDRVSLDRHELAKRAKDAGSAAVLLALLNCIVVWVICLLSLLKNS